MPMRLKWMLAALIVLAGAVAFKNREFLLGLVGRGDGDQWATSADWAAPPDAGNSPVSGSRKVASGTEPPIHPARDDLSEDFNLADLTIPRDEIITLLPPDAIPALTNPKRQRASDARWLSDEARVIEVAVADEVLGVPLRVLDWHEVVNTTVGGEPISVTYCPLCDSATVFSRRVTPRTTKNSGDGSDANPPAIVLEFGVSGSLFNSNVLMYDRKDKGLWSQLGMHAVSGPLAGTSLEVLPVKVVSFAAFKKTHPGATIVSKETGHERDYSRSPYESYFKDERLLVPVAGMGDALPLKTLGMGVVLGEGDATKAWFVPANVIGESFTLDTSAGKIVLAKNDAGVTVVQSPMGAGVRTAQTFYFSWSAFYPNTQVVKAGENFGAAADSLPATPGLAVGNKAPDATLTTIDGKTVSLASLYTDGPIVLTFYRGGWCPFCNRALSEWQNRLHDVTAAGGTFVAITPEKPDHAVATIEKNQLAYTVLRDTNFEAARAFRVHFVVDEATKAKYLQFGMDVGEANSSGTWELPSPATFVIDERGEIRYVFADWDYKRRADPDTVIAVLKSLTGK